MRSVDVVVIGAGQAGLSSGYFLRRAGLDHIILDADKGPGGAWQHRWPTLRMATVHGIHDLPDMPFEVVDETAPASVVLPAYFGAFEREFDLPVLRPVTVDAVRHGADERLLVETSAGTWSATARRRARSVRPERAARPSGRSRRC